MLRLRNDELKFQNNLSDTVALVDLVLSSMHIFAPRLVHICGEYHEFLSDFSARIFIAMSSGITFRGNSDDFTIFRFFTNLADRDLTECQITQTLTLS